MESVRPHIGDKVYRDMDPTKAVAQYNRDLALYEQAKSLEKIANQSENQNFNQNTTSGSLPYSTIPLDEEVYNISNTDYSYDEFINEFEKGSPLYNKFERLLKEYKRHQRKVEYYDYTFKGFLWFVFTCLFITIPFIFIINPSLFIYLGIGFGIDIIAFIINHTIVKTNLDEAQKLKEEMATLKYENKQKLSSYIPPVKRYAKRKPKPKEAKEKIVLHLEHN